MWNVNFKITVIDKIFEDYNNKIECQYSGNVTDDKAQVYQEQMDIDDEWADEVSSKAVPDMTASWFDSTIDEEESENAPVINLATGSNSRKQWKSQEEHEARKSNDIREAIVKAEEKAAKDFFAARKVDDDLKTANDAKDLDILKADMFNKTELIKTEAEKEFQKLKEQLLQQNEENQRHINAILESQKKSKELYDSEAKKLDERMDRKLLELFGTVNASIAAQGISFTGALQGTTSQVNELQVNFTKLESKLMDFMDQFSNKRLADISESADKKMRTSNSAA